MLFSKLHELKAKLSGARTAAISAKAGMTNANPKLSAAGAKLASTSPRLSVAGAKLASTSGESIAETLIAVLISSLALVFLCTAIVVAAHTNAALTSDDTAFELGSGTGAITVTVESGSHSASYERDGFVSDNGKYYYYE